MPDPHSGDVPAASGPVATAGEAPPPPAVAADVFGDRLPAARRYADLLATDAVERGLIGPREIDRVWERHLLNCAVVAPLVPAGKVVDLGSGAGLPGIVLALLRPDVRFTLLDGNRRRTDFLTQAVADLALANATVVWSRAEDLADADADAVVARAVAPLHRLVGWALPLLRPGGEVLALKGENARYEVDAAARLVARSGGGEMRIETVGVGVVDPPATVVRVPKVTQRRGGGRRGR